MRHTLRYVALLFAWLLPQIPIAQQNDIQFDLLHIEDGLSQSAVQAILQDSREHCGLAHGTA